MSIQYSTFKKLNVSTVLEIEDTEITRETILLLQ